LKTSLVNLAHLKLPIDEAIDHRDLAQVAGPGNLRLN